MNQDTASGLIETLPLPVLVIDADERVSAMNEHAVRLIGEHMRGRSYIAALRQPNLLDKVAAVLGTGEGQSGRYLDREAGRDTIYQVMIRPSPLGVVVSFVDQTAREDVGQLRRDFVANVSHELRTPLTALMGFIETLRGAAKSDPVAQDRFLNIMEHEASRMTRLVDDLLSLSRVEAEGRVRPKDSVELSEILTLTLANLDPVLTKSGVTVDVDDQSDGAVVLGDASQLRQVVSNLLENAAKYGKPEGNINISISGPEHDSTLRLPTIRLSVQDDGAGIEEHHLPRLTERFYRVDSHRSRAVGGTGLGLAIVKHIINRHRGRLMIESAPGKGTTFSVILPIATA